MGIFSRIKKLKRKDIYDKRLEKIPAPAWDYIMEEKFNYYERLMYMYFLDSQRTTSLSAIAEHENTTRQNLHRYIKKLYLANILLDEDFEEKNKYITNETRKWKSYTKWKDIDLEGKDYGAKGLINKCIEGWQEWKENNR